MNPPTLGRIIKRANFLEAAKSGYKFVKPSVVVQSRRRTAPDMHDAPLIRTGFTATRALGNAVIRNRVKRRLRAASARLVPLYGLQGCDYVFIGREQAYKGSFDDLIRDMKHALKRLADQMTAAFPPP